MANRDAIKDVVSRYVATKAGEAISSGVIIATNFVLTCFHSLRVDNDITVNDVLANVVAVDMKHDLAILSVPTEERSPVTLAGVLLGETVFSVGNPMGLSGALMFGKVVWQDEKRMFHDMHGAPGVSGSGLFDLQGNLVGVNHSVVGQKHLGNWLTVAVPSEEFSDIFSKVFSIRQPTPEEVATYGKAS